MDTLKTESIRSKTFELSTFKSLKTLPRRLKYAKDNLELLSDGGTSRIVFLLSSKKVLKISLLNLRDPKVNKKGIAQNEAEVRNSQQIPNLVTKVFEYAPDYSWIISELVRPLKSKEEFYYIELLRKCLKSDCQNNY